MDLMVKKIVGKLKRIQRLEKKEDRLRHHCEVLLGQVKQCNKVLPLAQKIIAMNIDISELLAFDTAVNQIARQYNLPSPVAVFRLIRDIKDYNKMGGVKKRAVYIMPTEICCQWNLRKSK
jgi:hypothetical protein